jgi:hypothetical protein
LPRWFSISAEWREDAVRVREGKGRGGVVGHDDRFSTKELRAAMFEVVVS